MTLPGSCSYEELLEQVRKLTHETIALQEEMSSGLTFHLAGGNNNNARDINQNYPCCCCYSTQKELTKFGDQTNSMGKTKNGMTTNFFCSLQKGQRQRHSTSSLPDNFLIGLTIPPGDLKSRLTIWREKNRQLQMSYQQYQRQHELGSTTAAVPVKDNNDVVGSVQQQLSGLDVNTSDEDVDDRVLSSLQINVNNAPSCDQSGSTKESSNSRTSMQSHAPNHSYKPSWPINQDSPSSWQKNPMHNELTELSSFSSTTGPYNTPSTMDQTQNRLGTKMDVVYNLLSMLGGSSSNSGGGDGNEGQDDMSVTLLSMSNSVDSCVVMRQSGCLPLLVQLIHAPEQAPEVRERASRALYNVVHARVDEKSSKREIRVLRLLEQLRDYCQTLRSSLSDKQVSEPEDESERHPGSTIAALMKLSFDEAHRHAMCLLGGLHAVAELIEMDHSAHGSETDDQNCITLRRYAGMALTNLTFGDGNNKALLCSFREFMKALVSQLGSPSDDLRQVTASVLRNLSWRADSSSKQTLREVKAVVGLMKAAMEGRKESTLKSILSALWNLSAHCRTNKMDICGVEGALAFLVDTLSYNAPSKTLAIVENAGGILRNVSSYIAVRDDYRAIVRERGCLQVLLRQLRSPSLTVVSNACGTLWNLSARCPQDQRLLWELGAVPMLRSLVHSKHKMISMGSSAALKNLLSACPNPNSLVHVDSTAKNLGLPTLPSLAARKQKALEQEIDQNLSETCDNIEPSNSPLHKEEEKFSFKLDESFLQATSRTDKALSQLQVQNLNQAAGPSNLRLPLNFPRSESRKSMRSVTSTQSDTIFEKVNRQARQATTSMTPSDLQIKQQSASLHSAVNFDSGIAASAPSTKGHTEKKYTLRYMNAIPERLKPGEPLPDLRGLSCSNSTISWSLTPQNQDSACTSKSLLRSSVEDENLAQSSSSKTQSAYQLDDNVNYNLLPKSCKKIASPIEDGSSRDFMQMNIAVNSAQTPAASNDACKIPSQSSSCSSGLGRSTSQQKISETSQQQDAAAKQNNFNFQLHGNAFDLAIDSPRSITTTTSGASSLTLEANKSLESDSAIFEGEHDSEQNAKISNFSLPKEKVFNDKTCSQNKGSEQPLKKANKADEGQTMEMNNFNQYKKSENLNKIQNAMDRDLNQLSHLTPLELKNGQQMQDDDDYSEVSQTNDYYTVQETYTLEKNAQPDDSLCNTFVNEECSISQQCSTTLDYVSVEDDDDNSLSDAVCKNLVFESARSKSELETTAANTLNVTSFESFDSIERSEQALLELCIKSGMSKAETLMSNTAASAMDEKSKSHDAHDGLNRPASLFAASMKERVDQSVPRQMEGEITDKTQQHDEYRRQRDPDAMIASLDRLTAALVQQSEAMRERDLSSATAMKASLLSDCTWNDDESPNEVSFPSLSTSAPLVASFKSDLQDQEPSIQTDSASQVPPSGVDRQQAMTESKIIQMEAIKLAEAVVKDNQSGLASIILDEINPPSTMGSLISLTASIGGPIGGDNSAADYSGDVKGQPDSLPPMLSSTSSLRKKSLPIGVVARRALSHGQNRTASLENLLNECNGNHSQLENVKPPSIMDELLDLGDMENSMLSVASITSEIADIGKDNDFNGLASSGVNFDLIKPVANVLSLTCMKYVDSTHGSATNSLSECLENINPPSLFNEVNQMDESTVESSTRGKDTLCADVELACEKNTQLHCALDERIEDLANDTDDAVTPISSEHCSSVESTPKRHHSKTQSGGHLTPKQKRQLVKERYKTYTIAAERVKKEQEDLKKQEKTNGNVEEENTVSKCVSVSKLTPKQRRQEDRARFQTQVLAKPENNVSEESEVSHVEEKPPSPVDNAANTPVKSGIPMFRRFSSGAASKIKRNTEQNQRRASERYRTRTLDLDEISSAAADSDESREYAKPHLSSLTTIMQNLAEENAKQVVSNDSQASNKKNTDVPSESNQAEETHEANGNVQKVNGEVQQVQRAKSDLIASVRNDYFNESRSQQQHYYDDYNDDDDDDSQKSDNDDEEEGGERGEGRKARGPRIVKPGEYRRDLSVESNGTDKSEPEVTPKGIRGRRKPLYSKPSAVKTSTPQSSPMRQFAGSNIPPPISRSNSSPVVRATRATALRQQNSSGAGGIPQKSISTTATTPIKPRTSIPQRSPASAPVRRQPPEWPQKYQQQQQKATTPVKLERQGTFTKDEPAMNNVLPTVSQPSPYRAQSAKTPAKTAGKTSPKTSPIHAKSKLRAPTQRTINTSTVKLTKTTSVEKMTVGSSIPMLTKRATTNLCSPVVKSSSNYQIGSNAVAAAAAAAANDNTPRKMSLGQRSNSNLSTVSNSSSQANRKVKETASKIATLWKKVEESKSKQQKQQQLQQPRYIKRDTRQWITSRTMTQVDSPPGSGEGGDQDQTCNLYRSSTFEGITKSSSHGFVSPTV